MPTPSPAAAPERPVALRRLGTVELIALLALSMSLTALAIDLMLPAFPAIREELGLAADSNATAGLITAYFLGLAVGTVLFGILADGIGRRRALYVGYAVYGLGAVAALLAPSLPTLLAARALWGLGAAGGRVVTLAVIRDTWSGDRMSRAMSFVLAVFILVPIVSPALGSVVVDVAPWRWTFGICAIAVAVVALWALRLPETLADHHRRSMRPRRVAEAGREVLRHRRSLAGGLALMSLYAVFTSWIASAELIISDVFDRGESFPLVFGGLAAVLGLGMLLNARIVERFGTTTVTRTAMTGYIGASVLFLVVVVIADGTPAFWLFAVTLAALLGAHALLVPNINSLAMEPVGHVAGTASAVLGAMQIAGGAALGAVLDRLYDGTVGPLAWGFLCYGLVSAALVRWGLTAAGDVEEVGDAAPPRVAASRARR